MFYSGLADEAARDPARQLQAHRELGWSHIELRTVDGSNITDLSGQAFDSLRGLLLRAGLQVSCFSSQIANWSRPINSDLERDLSDLRRAIPRMKSLSTPFIRCMSYPNATPPWPEPRWREEAIRRMRELARIAEEGEVTLVHENCSGWGGLGPEATLELLRRVDSPRLKLVFDTGNPAQYGADSWDYYQAVRDHIAYVHIKDYLPRGPKGEERACLPGEGTCHVKEIVADLRARGYDGGFSIEPHIASVIHLKKEIEDPELAYRTYLDYGRRFQRLAEEAGFRARG
jgi:sugar phosphate isomerase/epimerase